MNRLPPLRKIPSYQAITAACLMLGMLLIPVLRANGAFVSLDFEDLPDQTPVGDFYADYGVHFQNALSFTVGLSLNELDFPPGSGVVVVGDDNAPITIRWDGTASGISSWFAYGSRTTFTAYAPDGSEVGSYVTGELELEPGFDPVLNPIVKKYISLSFAGVERLTIAGEENNVYIMDDFTYDWQPIPEPSTYVAGFCTFVVLAVSWGKGQKRSDTLRQSKGS